MELEDADGLRIVVFCQREVFGGKARQGFAVLISDRNSLDDELRTDLQGEGRLLLLRCSGNRKNEQKEARSSPPQPTRQQT